VRPLTTAVGNYGVTRSLKDGSVACGRVKLEHVAVDSAVAGMGMVRDLEFDICEMAFTTYLCAKLTVSRSPRSRFSFHAISTTGPASTT
jgi:4,5-dihydroxyphthalate decarboxylase